MEELILKEREIKEELIKIINNSGLPAFILKSIIKEFLEQLNILSDQEYKESLKIKQEKLSKIDIAAPTKSKKGAKDGDN